MRRDFNSVFEYYETFVENKNDEGKYVKFHAYVSDRCYISVDDVYNHYITDLFKQYDLQTHYTVACIQSRDYTDNYGPDLNIMYLEDRGLDYTIAKLGDYITVYGYCASNGGVYGTLVIPKYIEKSKYGEEWK